MSLVQSSSGLNYHTVSTFTKYAVANPIRGHKRCTRVNGSHRRYFQHAQFIPIVGVGKRGEYELVHGDLPRQHSFGTTFEVYWPCVGGL